MYFMTTFIGSKERVLEYQLILILLHGTACVESDFSASGDVSLKETSLIAQHQVYDANIAKGVCLLNIDITTQMLTFAILKNVQKCNWARGVGSIS